MTLEIRINRPDPEYICRTLCESKCIRDCRVYKQEGYELGYWVVEEADVIDFQIYKDKTANYQVHSSMSFSIDGIVDMLLRFPIYNRPDMMAKDLINKYDLGIKRRMHEEDMHGGAAHFIGTMVYRNKAHAYKLVQRIKNFIDELLIQEAKGKI